MKTIEEWLKELPEPYRSAAIRNCEEEYKRDTSSSLGQAITLAFNWHDSPEGDTFWGEVCKDFIHNDHPLPPLYKYDTAGRKQVGGDHYEKKRIQPIEYIIANNLGFCEGNIVKYITRYQDKDGMKDLEKCRDYIDILIQQEKDKGGE